MREVKKLTLSAILCALAVAIMALGAVIETVDMTMAALASLTAVLVYVEIGQPYTYLCWLVTTLLVGLLFPQSLMWAEYLLIFGVYPFLKGYIERLPRMAWPFIKFVYFNAALLGLLLALRLVLGVPLFDGAGALDTLIDIPALRGNVPVLTLILWGLGNITLFAYDLFLTVVLRLYVAKYRARFRRFFK